MPTVTVKNYNREQVTKPLEGGLRAAVPTAEGFGAATGEKLTQVGIQLYRDEQERQDEVAIVEAERKLSDWELKRMYDPKEGALSRRGKDAFGLPDTVTKEYDDTVTEIRKSLSNERQRSVFDRSTVGRRRSISEKLNVHVMSEVRKFDDVETDNLIKNAQQIAIANAGDEKRIGEEIDRQQQEIMRYAQRHGLGAEYVSRKLSVARAETHTGVVERLLANGRDVDAKTYVEKYRKEIESGGDIAKVEKWIEEGSTRGESQRQADAILGTATTREDAVTKAREIKDPKLRDAVEERVNRYWSVKREAERETREKNMTDAANLIDATGRTSSISPSVWNSFSVSERTQLEQYAKRKEKGEDAKTDLGTYYGLITMASTPGQQEKFSKLNLMDYINKLGKQDFKHIAEVQASIRKNDNKAVDKLLASDRVQNQIVNDAVLAMGLDPTPNEKTSKAKRDQVLEFRRVVRDSVSGHEQRIGRNATDKEVQEIVDNLIVKGVTKPGIIFDDTRRVFELKEGETLTIKPADVPPAERRKIEAALRRQGRAVTDEAVTTLYTARILRMRGIAPAPAAPSLVDQVPK